MIEYIRHRDSSYLLIIDHVIISLEKMDDL